MAHGQAWAALTVEESMVLGDDVFLGNDQFVHEALVNLLWVLAFMKLLAAGATIYAPPMVPAAEPSQLYSDSSASLTRRGWADAPNARLPSGGGFAVGASARVCRVSKRHSRCPTTKSGSGLDGSCCHAVRRRQGVHGVVRGLSRCVLAMVHSFQLNPCSIALIFSIKMLYWSISSTSVFIQPCVSVPLLPLNPDR